ncbi:MAG: transposase [Patescibacteria group bacterium]|nr:transposase [Patescibacteria group bacterium]
MRKIKFQNNYYYHIYNRGVDKRDVFMDEKDFVRFIRSIREFNTINPIGSLYQKEKHSGSTASEAVEPLVEIITYCLNPNHYHLILKQLTENGISEFIRRLSGGYTWYFNFKNNRSGTLFQGKFKSIHINTDSYLLWLSGYINGNPEIHKIAKAENYKWSSYPDYLGKRDGTLCNKNIILKDFKNIQEYKNLVNIIIRESRQRKDDIKKYLLE